MTFNLSPLGTLAVVAVSAVELKNRDGLFGKNDAYTLFKVGRQRGRTKTQFNAGSKATWNEEFIFQIYGKEDLEVICYDYDKFTSDDIIGSTVIPLNTLFEINYIENWFKLTYKGKYCGKIHLRISFTLARPSSPPLPANSANLRHTSSLASRVSNYNDTQLSTNNRLSPVPQVVSPSSYPPSGSSSFPVSMYPPPSSPSHSPFLYPQATTHGGTYISNSGETSPNPYNSQSRPNSYAHPITPSESLYPPPRYSVGPPSKQTPPVNGYSNYSAGYPPMTSSQPYPPAGSQAYPPSNGGYPPAGSQAYPPSPSPYPPAGSQVYPPPNNAHPSATSS